MRRVALSILVLALPLFVAQCGDSGGGGGDNDVAPTDDTVAGQDADTTGGGTDTEPADIPGGVDTGPADVPPADVPIDTGTPPDDADVAPPPDEVTPPDTTDVADTMDVGPDVDAAGCTVDADCEEFGDLCNIATCDDGQCAVAPKDCRETPEDDLCTIDVCNPQDGSCQHEANPECFICTSDEDCDDRNPCTTDTCVPEEGCQNVANTLGCQDGNPCTDGDTCMEDPSGLQPAVCGAGGQRNCDDEDECTLDWCDPLDEAGCRHLTLTDCDLSCDADTPCPSLPGNPCVTYTCEDGTCVQGFTTAACDDDNVCTVGDTCADGVCTGGATLDCDDGDLTTLDACVPELEGCVHPQIVTPPRCVTVADCPANTNPCRETLCSDEGYCVTVSIQSSCDDGDFCTVNDFCQDGQCVGGVARDCSDVCEGNPFCTPVCSSEDVECQAVGIDNLCPELPTGCETGSDCNDGDPCTTDSCVTFLSPSQCACSAREACSCNPNSADGGASACDDNDPCTIDECVPNDDPSIPQHAGLCTHEFSPENCCEVACTDEDDDATCADGDKCTIDTCELLNVDTGAFCCTNPRLPPPCGLECDGPEDCSDGNPGTADVCGDDGTCDPPGPDLRECTSTDVCLANAELYEDDNECTSLQCVDTFCVNVPNTNACDDGDACTINDVCQEVDDESVCLGEARVCNPPNECSECTCDAVEGCICTLIDPLPPECEDCQTQIGADPDYCADGDPCTIDICGTDGQCQHDDLNEGADTPLCIPVTCGDETQCDDGNPCTLDTCVPPEPDPTPGDGDTPTGACHYVETANCEILPALTCADETECDLADCAPDTDVAFCRNPVVDCPALYCDTDVGCRFVPTASCPIGECTPTTQARDCFDSNPCTIDTCDAETRTCLSPEEAPSAIPEDNLYTGCVACETAVDCEESDLFDAADPCLAIECRYPDPDHPDTPSEMGFCYVHIDQELFPNGCEDYDLCTIDTCVPGVGCDHASRGDDCAVCVGEESCDDRDPCTTDICDPYTLTCVNEPIANCQLCETDTDCPGYTGSVCDGEICIFGHCVVLEWGVDPTDEPVCLTDTPCTTGADCGGSVAGVYDAVCLTGADNCILYPTFIPGEFCDLDDPEESDCGDSVTPCMDVVCNDELNTCEQQAIPGCTPTACTGRADCDDANACTVDLCIEGNCVNWLRVDMCCDTAGDCQGIEGIAPNGCGVVGCDPATSTCIETWPSDSARCNVKVCETDDDCARACTEFVDPDTGEVTGERCIGFCTGSDEGGAAGGECYDWPCAKTACNAHGTCIWFDGDCTECTNDGECVDPDPCTIDTCVDGACQHDPDPVCAPVACDADTICDNGDICTVGMCFSGECVWFPNPYCQ